MLWNRLTLEVATLVALVAAVGGCANVDDGSPPIPTDLTIPTAVIESHAQALTRMDFDAYEALMEKPVDSSFAGFRFYCREDDADEFLWLIGDSWDYDAERDMIRNMMNPAFDGEGPAVETMRMDIRLLDEQILGDLVQVTIDADIRVMASPDGGWLANPRLVFTLVSDADGFLRIRAVREQMVATIEGATWGRIKARYRGPGPAIPVDLTRPRDVIESYARTIDHKNIEVYTALLTPDFEYVVRPGDATDIPWLEGDSWGIEDELAIMTNMMDPNFQGEQPPVRVMRFAYGFLHEEIVEQGVAITVDANVVALASPGDGWFTSTRFDFLLVRDARGFYRIREIREREHPGGSPESWGQIKARYR